MGQIRVEQRNRVLLATLENPPHGLMDAGIVDDLDGLVRRASDDDQIGAVVLTGAHPERFVAHYDVAELLAGAQAGPAVTPRVARASLRLVGGLRRVAAAEQAISRTPAAGLAAIDRFHSILLSMNRSGAVFVAAINGSAMGGGCELALACDVRLAASGDHLLGQPEILFGFPPGGGGTQRLARLLGSGRALAMVLGGEPLTPAQAFDIGLVSEVIPGEQLLERALAVAGRLGRRPKLGIAASKRAVYEGASSSLPEGLRVEAAEFIATLGSPDAIAAMSAYVERTNSTGVLPAYDRPVLEQALAEGRFRKSDDTDRV